MLLRRYYVTLIEILIVFAILSLIAGLIGINITKASRQQQFRNEVDIVVNQLRLAQDLMLIFRGQASVKFWNSPDKDGFDCTLEFESKMPGNWDKETKRVHKLTSIHAIDFYDQINLPELKQVDNNTLYIRFLSNGTKISKGIMRLASSKDSGPGVYERFICLPGYPIPIVSLAYHPGEKCLDEDKSFKNSLTQATASEVQNIDEEPDEEEDLQ